MTDSGSALEEALRNFGSGLDDAERHNWQLMLSAMIGEFGRKHGPKGPTADAERATWRSLVKAAASLYPGGARAATTPRFVTDLLPELASEAENLESGAERLGPSEFLGSGPIAARMSRDPRLTAGISREVGADVGPVRSCHYFYYNREGDHLLPHIDSASSSGVIFLLALRHVPPVDGGPGSALVVHTPQGEAKRFPLRAGESILLLGAGTVHEREPLGPGEKITLLSIGHAFGPHPPEPLWREPLKKGNNVHPDQ